MPYNCLRGAYEKLKLVLCISKAPLWHPWGSAKALGHEHKRNSPSLFPFFFPLQCLYFSSVFALFYTCLSLVWLSFIPQELFLVFVFHLFVSRFSLFWFSFAPWEGPKESPTKSWHWFGFWVTPWIPHLGGQGGGHTLWWNWTWAQSDEESEVR